MSDETAVAEHDWSAPATRGELRSVKHDLEAKIDRLDSKVDQIAADLKAEIKGVRADLAIGLKGVRADLAIGLKDVQVSVGRIVWTAVATLGAVGILLRFF